MSKCVVHNSCDWPSWHVITLHCLLLLTWKGQLNLGHTKKKLLCSFKHAFWRWSHAAPSMSSVEHLISSTLSAHDLIQSLTCPFHHCLKYRLLYQGKSNVISALVVVWQSDVSKESAFSVVVTCFLCIFLVMLPEKQSDNCRFSCILGVFSETMYIKGKFPWMTWSLLIFTEKVSWMACNRHLSSSILVLSLRGCLFVLFAVVIFHLCHFPCVSIFNRNVNRVEALRHLLHRLRYHWCRATSCKRGDTSWWMRCDWRWTWSGARTSSGRAVRRADGVRE